MGRLILFLSLVGLALLFALSIINPGSPALWLASSSQSFQLLRAALMIILTLLLVTTPPRNPYFRTFVGLVSLGLIGWCLNATYNNAMQLVDCLALLQVGVAIGLAALEKGFEESREAVIRGKKIVYEKA